MAGIDLSPIELGLLKLVARGHPGRTKIVHLKRGPEEKPALTWDEIQVAMGLSATELSSLIAKLVGLGLIDSGYEYPSMLRFLAGSRPVAFFYVTPRGEMLLRQMLDEQVREPETGTDSELERRPISDQDMVETSEVESYVNTRARGQFVLNSESRDRGFLAGTIVFRENRTSILEVGAITCFVYWKIEKFAVLEAPNQPIVWLMTVEVGEDREREGYLVDSDLHELWRQLMFTIQDYARGNPFFLLSNEEVESKIRSTSRSG